MNGQANEGPPPRAWGTRKLRRFSQDGAASRRHRAWRVHLTMSHSSSSGARAGNPDCGQCRAIAARYTNVHIVTCSDCTGGQCPLCGDLTLRWTGERMLGCPECGVHWPRAVILSHQGFAEAKARWGWPDWQRLRG